MSGETVLVTGASGFVAGHCILQLLDQGYRVRGTLRDPARAGEVLGLVSGHRGGGVDIDFVRADLSGDDGWDKAVAGCTYVLHVASPIPHTLPRDRQALIGPARDGALRVLKAAKAGGVSRVVLTSSAAAIAYGHTAAPTKPYTEEDWTNLKGRQMTAYVESKAVAERAAWDYVRADGRGLELSVINPTGIFGPILGKDIGSSPEIIRRIMTRAIPAYPNLGFAIVDVRDVARAHILAMTNPAAAGERFIASGEWRWMHEIGAILQEAFPDRRLPRGRMPDWFVRGFAIFSPALRQLLPELGRKRDMSNDKARRVLGLEPRSPEEALVATAQSLIDQGLVK